MLQNVLTICIESSAALESELSIVVLVYETVSEKLGLNNLQNTGLHEKLNSMCSQDAFYSRLL